ncbi:hypothetical protein HDU67_005076 [Dinochytrium kinnereticum]|nr:hypothetical protein HDU67_005076 [Dinochytrium kinnereticum]
MARDILRETLLLPLVGEECSFTLLQLSPEILQSPCFSLFISKGLGLAIIVGGSIVKVPQLIKIVGARSAKGISLISYILETFSLMISLAYNYRAENPFSTYGEIAFITVQNVIIAMLILYFSNRHFMMLLFLVISQAIMYALLSASIVPQATLVYLQWVSIFLGSASKVPQIIVNFMNGSTGQLSAITMGLQSVGSAARVFTTMREIADQVLIMGSVIAASLNAILFAQILLLGGGSKKEKEAASSSGSQKKPADSKKKK